MQYVATCLFGLEKYLGEEIDALGFHRLETLDGRIIFEAGEDGCAVANIGLRCAERVFVLLGRYRAETFDELFEGTRALPLEDFISERDAFPVSGHSVKSKLTSIPDCQKIIKKAAVERLKSKYGISWFEETGLTYSLEFLLLRDECFLMLDTSGDALHKRGYRSEAGIAPLRETLACAMVKISRPRENVILFDPMCGSGTIAAEAALLMTNTAPGLKRGFAAEKFPAFPEKIWREVRNEAREAVRETDFRVCASDIDPRMAQLTQANISRAGMSKYVHTECADALELSALGRRGTIVCNPPYGERMFTGEQTENLYRDMGKHFATLDRWQIYILTPCEYFEKLYGRRADKKRRLYNGMIRCTYYQFFK